jgi:ATP-dependent helicase/nuclease subunit A
MTRAEERLYVGGALSAADRNGPPGASWYRAVEQALVGLGAEWREDKLWGRSMVFGDAESPAKAIPRRPEAGVELPQWLTRPAPVESRPPRPLAPSALGEDDVADPPPTPAMRAAAERGRLLHQLFERLPDVAEQERKAVAESWLEHSAGVEDPALRRSIVEDACTIIADPRYAGLFGPESLAEAPIAALVGEGVVVSGTVDRLLVADDRILVADFKTGRRVPRSLAEIPLPHLRQMAAYVEALERIFPGRRVEANLLYTGGPLLHALPRDFLAAHAPAAVGG